MHPFRLVALGGIGFAVVSMLLPFASFPIVGPVDGIAGDAWPALVPLVVVAGVTLSGRWDRGLEPGAGVTAVASAGLALVFGLVKVADAIVAVRQAAGATVGPGAFALAAAAAVVAGAAAFGALART